MEKLFVPLLLLVFALALIGCATEAPPTAESAEPANENTSRENGADNQSDIEPPREVSEGFLSGLVEFDTLESFLSGIRGGTLSRNGTSGNSAFNLTRNKARLLFPAQNRKRYPLKMIEYNQQTGNYSFVYALDGVANEHRLDISTDFSNSSHFRTIQEFARYEKGFQWASHKIFEIIDDTYLFVQFDHEWSDSMRISWIDGGTLFHFSVSNNSYHDIADPDNWNLDIDRERFFEIFENFQFVDFATMEREVLGQSTAE